MVVRDVQLRHVCTKLVPLDTSSKGKEVSPVQDRHVPLKVVPLETSIPDGKEVKLALLQARHVSVKFVPLETSNAGKEVSPVQPFHAPAKLMSSSAWVENVVVAGKEVSPVQSTQVLLKLVPRDRFKAGNVVRAVQLRHAPPKLISSSAWVENVTAGKEVKLASVQPFHALVKLVPLARFR